MKFGLFSLFDFFRGRQNEVTYYQDTLDLEQVAFDLHARARDTGRAKPGLDLFAQEVIPEFR